MNVEPTLSDTGRQRRKKRWLFYIYESEDEYTAYANLVFKPSSVVLVTDSPGRRTTSAFTEINYTFST